LIFTEPHFTSIKRKEQNNSGPFVPLNRREFIKLLSTGALSAAFLAANLQDLLAQDSNGESEPLVWLQGHCCENHQIGLAGVPEFPGFLARYFQRLEAVVETANDAGKAPILILEGYFSNDNLEESRKQLQGWAEQAKVVVLLGNEAAYSADSPEGYLDLDRQLFADLPTSVIRLPGHPAQPRHILGLLNHLLMYGLPSLDEHRRPKIFFDALICDRCEHRGDFESGDFVSYFGEKLGCLYLLGCKGRVTYNDCPTGKWNEDSNWCVGAGSPCTGCSEPEYPGHLGVGAYGQLSHRIAGVKTGWLRHAENLAYGVFGVTLGGLGLHGLTRRSIKRYQLNDDEDET